MVFKHIFMCFLAICVSPLLKFNPFLIFKLGCYLYWVVIIVTIIWIQMSYQLCNLDYFIPFSGLSDCLFTKKKNDILWNTKLSCDESYLSLFYLACAYGFISNTPFPNQVKKNVLLFFFQSFILLALTFRSVIKFD